MLKLSQIRSLVLIALLAGAGLTISASLSCKTEAAAALGILYVVNSTGNGYLVGPSDVCDDGSGNCTLRAAIEASNSHFGTDGIRFNIPTTDPGYSGGKWTINLPSALPAVTDSVNISGPTASQLTIRDTGGSYSILNITTTSTVNLSGVTIDNGGFVLRGGGIDHENGGTLNVSDCVFSNNGGDEGGAINSAGDLTVSNCLFSANDSATGGAIENVGTATVATCTFTGNSAGGFGGGAIYNSGTLTVSNSTISGNMAPGSSSDGGGIYNSGTLTVANSTLSGNSAFSSGGGISSSNGVVNVTNCTIAANSASVGGGVGNSAVSFNIKSTIIASNTAASATNPQDVYGTFASQGFNLIGKTDGSFGFNAATDRTGTLAAPLDPGFDPKGLKDNGGPTHTIALIATSPAIDGGSGTGLTGVLTTDQRGVGYKRTINKSAANADDGTDIGAFEFGAQIKAVSRKTHGSAGPFDLTLPLSGKVAVECRKGTTQKMIITFPNPVTVGSVTVTPDPAAAGATASVSSYVVNGSVVTVNLSGVSNRQIAVINLFDVSDGTNNGEVHVPFGLLIGDVSGNGSVTSNDVSTTQSKVGQPVTKTTFREDVTLDGSISSADVQLVTSKKGMVLPP